MKINSIRITFITIISFSIILLSCNKEKKLHTKLKQVITEYISKDFEKGEKLDSIKILQVDSVSDYHFTKYILENVIENRLEELSFACSHLSDTTSIEELQLKQKYESEINMLIDKTFYYQSLLKNANLDSTNFKYFFVTTKIYTTKHQQQTQEYYGFPITSDFKVREINEIIF